MGTPIGPTRADAQYIGEVVAHEIGHTLGCRHVNPDISADPDNIEVMDNTRDTVAGKDARFINAVSEISDWTGMGRTHNPLYHIKRYVDGVAHEDLVRQGTVPGDWDKRGGEYTIVRFDFGDAAQVVHNVHVFSGQGADIGNALAFYDNITLTELSSQQFIVEGGSFLQLVASSTEDDLIDIINR